MRIATPMSLLLVSMVRARTDEIIVRGPFAHGYAMMGYVSVVPYPKDNQDDIAIVTFNKADNRWYDWSGEPLIVWTLLTVDEALMGHPKEREKAKWVMSEFPAEESSVFFKDEG